MILYGFITLQLSLDFVLYFFTSICHEPHRLQMRNLIRLLNIQRIKHCIQLPIYIYIYQRKLLSCSCSSLQNLSIFVLTLSFEAIQSTIRSSQEPKYYPSLNRSRCCMKGICTECFLQLKTPNPTRPAQCPFCKSLNYGIEYRGMKTKEEKGFEQIEDQRVIEVKIRMQQQELQEQEDRKHKRHEISSSSRIIEPGKVECRPLTESEEFVSSQYSPAASTTRQPLHSRNNRDDELDLGLEDIMVMEAIWLSIQENGRQKSPAYGEAARLEQYITEDCCGLAVMSPLAETSSPPSDGLACAIAALGERQQMGRESSSKYNGNISAFSLLPCGRFSNIEEQVTENHPPAGSLIEASPYSSMAMAVDGREWGLNHGLEVAEEGTIYASSDAVEDEIRVSPDSRIAALPP
ncbi:E3 ubiquitin-protein ligase DA2L-like [Cornus florida]|uniref:E3 ubiquitin-protein ligase DA2L-like n=1 Tax=Cornus florida TaxID=4283 RepID=UPI00289A5297|nr:E3 ubiquitin-protein ligase DA2L-like [Cornus florida]